MTEQTITVTSENFDKFITDFFGKNKPKIFKVFSDGTEHRKDDSIDYFLRLTKKPTSEIDRTYRLECRKNSLYVSPSFDYQGYLERICIMDNKENITYYVID